MEEEMVLIVSSHFGNKFPFDETCQYANGMDRRRLDLHGNNTASNG
jgi:hypothetical protein